MESIKDLEGKILTEIITSEDNIIFVCDDKSRYQMCHIQKCCELVVVEDICGDLQDLIGVPILEAREDTSKENPEGIRKEDQNSFTWTFYNLRTIKGSVTIRWYGDSNGYYSESVNFERVDRRGR